MFGQLTFQLLYHLGRMVPELRLVLRQFSVVLFQAITLHDRTIVLLSKTDHFGFQAYTTAVTTNNATTLFNSHCYKMATYLSFPALYY